MKKILGILCVVGLVVSAYAFSVSNIVQSLSVNAAQNVLVALIKGDSSKVIPMISTSPGYSSQAVLSSSGTKTVRIEWIKGQNDTCSAGTCNYINKSPGITSVTWTATGQYNVNFAAGTWSDVPACTMSSHARGANYTHCGTIMSSASTTTYPIGCSAGTTASNDNPTVMCVGFK